MGSDRATVPAIGAVPLAVAVSICLQLSLSSKHPRPRRGRGRGPLRSNGRVSGNWRCSIPQTQEGSLRPFPLTLTLSPDGGEGIPRLLIVFHPLLLLTREEGRPFIGDFLRALLRKQDLLEAGRHH